MTERHPIQVVFFDLGNVLLNFDHMLACRSLAEFSPFSPDQIHTKVFVSGFTGLFESGRLTPKEFFHRMIREVQLVDMDYDKFRLLWSDIFEDNPGMEELVHSTVPPKGKILISNTDPLHFEHVRNRFPILGYLDHFILSYEAGIAKPDKAIFERALMVADVDPTEALFIDDLDEHCNAANKLGLTAIRYESVSQLKRKLIEAGLLPSSPC